jgi:hypothetical protein
MSWVDLAACQKENPDRFHPVPYGRDEDAKADYERDVEQTKRICFRCPVFTACWDEHVPVERYGIWAGTTEEERHRMRRNQARKELAERRAAEQVTA